MGRPKEGRRRDLDALVAGYVCLDMTPELPRAARSLAGALRPGKLVEIGALTVSLGGAVANTGLALKAFGKKVSLAVLLGKDSIGDLIVGLLKKHGARFRARRAAEAGSAYSIVLAPKGTDRCFLESPGCNAVFSSADVDFGLVRRSRLFHLGYPPLLRRLYADGGRELQRIFSRARAAGAATSLDMSLPDPASPSGKADWPAILERALPHVDIFVPSIEEILFMLAPREYRRLNACGGDAFDAVPERTFREFGDRILAMGVRVLLIKAGRRGAYLRTGDVSALNSRTALDLPEANWGGREMWVPSFRADRRRVVNANGAGDAAVAGFLAAMLGGEPIEVAGRLAMLAGRDSLYGADALTGLRAWTDMKADLGPTVRP